MVSKTTFNQFKTLEQLAAHLTRHFQQEEQSLVTPDFSVQDEKLIIDFAYDKYTTSERIIATWNQLLFNHEDVDDLIEWTTIFRDEYQKIYVKS